MAESFLRHQKAIALQRWYNNGFHKKDISYSSIQNATILPLKKEENDILLFGKGGVVVGDTYIESSGIEGRVGGFYSYNSGSYKNEKVVYCGALIHQWGHFLVESVARIWYFLENDVTVDKYIFISNIANFPSVEEIQGNYREFFSLLGILDKIEICMVATTYREVIIPELAYSRKYYYSEKYKAVFDQIRKNALSREVGERPERVFLSRSALPKAKLNEFGLDLLDNFFIRNGYKILYPEKLSLSELIYQMFYAKICAAESGTLPHNCLFCEDGKKIIIVERQTTINEIQANIDQIKDLDVIYIDGAYSLYPTLAGFGPYLFGYNRQLEQFTYVNGYLPPDKQFISPHYLHKRLKQYLKAYKNVYGYCWGIEQWQTMYINAYWEAYKETEEVFEPWLSGSKFLFWTDLFDLHIWKNVLRRIIK